MDIQVHCLGKEVHGLMVPTHDEVANRTDEGCSPNDKDTSRANIELVRSQRNHISGCSGGSEQQKQSDYQIAPGKAWMEGIDCGYILKLCNRS